MRGRRCCPECGSYEVHPHCRRDDCDAWWCARAQCGWDSVVPLNCEAIALEPGIHAWDLESIAGFSKQQFKPVMRVGFFRAHAVLKGRWIASGWQFDMNSEHPDWPEDQLFEMRSILGKIEEADLARA